MTKKAQNISTLDINTLELEESRRLIKEALLIRKLPDSNKKIEQEAIWEAKLMLFETKYASS